MSTVLLSASFDYVQGHLRYGHLEAEVDEAEIEGMSPEQLEEYLEDVGEFVLDDYSLEDKGELGEVTIKKAGK